MLSACNALEMEKITTTGQMKDKNVCFRKPNGIEKQSGSNIVAKNIIPMGRRRW